MKHRRSKREMRDDRLWARRTRRMEKRALDGHRPRAGRWMNTHRPLGRDAAHLVQEDDDA